MLTKAIAVAGAALMLGVFAVTTDAYAQGLKLGGGYSYRISPSGNLVVRGTPPNSGVRPTPNHGAVTGQTPHYFNANPTHSTNQNFGTDFSVSGPYVGLKYQGNQ